MSHALEPKRNKYTPAASILLVYLPLILLKVSPSDATSPLSHHPLARSAGQLRVLGIGAAPWHKPLYLGHEHAPAASSPSCCSRFTGLEVVEVKLSHCSFTGSSSPAASTVAAVEMAGSPAVYHSTRERRMLTRHCSACRQKGHTQLQLIMQRVGIDQSSRDCLSK